VFITMPCYGDQVYSDALDAYQRGIIDPRTVGPEMRIHPAGGVRPRCSATTENFNICLATALDARDRGEATHVAMIHSDVAPVGPWVSQLYNEMRLARVALISAVVRIKNPTGRTSTAIAERADPWAPIRRFIQLDQRESMPVTFTPQDVCQGDEVLLVNTGLWLADLRMPFWDDFSFQWHDRISRDPDGRRRVQFRPEDWELSRALDAGGLR
jgi:hypothetical protein